MLARRGFGARDTVKDCRKEVEKQVLAALYVEEQDNALELGEGVEYILVLVVVRVGGIKKGGYNGRNTEVEDILYQGRIVG